MFKGWFSLAMKSQSELLVKIKNQSRRQSHKLDGIREGRIRMFPFSFDSAVWLAQLVEHQSAVREVEVSSPRPDQQSGS